MYVYIFTVMFISNVQRCTVFHVPVIALVSPYVGFAINNTDHRKDKIRDVSVAICLLEHAVLLLLQ